MKKKLFFVLFSALLVFTPVALWADQFYGGLGLLPASGQPDYEADGIMNLTVGYETENYGLSGWRFSYSMTNFKHDSSSSSTLDSHIFAAETLFVAKIKDGLTLIGAVGPAFFRTSAAGRGYSESGMDIGLSATGSIRFALDAKMFLSTAYHYKNCAVSSSGGSVDGGLQGFFLNFGAFF